MSFTLRPRRRSIPPSTCQTYRGFNASFLDKSEWFSISVPDIIQSSGSGCASCRVLQTAVKELCLLGSDIEKAHEYGIHNITRDSYSVDFLMFSCMDIYKAWFSFRIYRAPDSTCPSEWHDAVSISHDTDDAASPASFLWVQKQMKDCIRSHPSCPSSARDPLLPTRVLDLGPPTKASRFRFFKRAPKVLKVPAEILEAPVKVLVTKHNMRGRYLTLSHRWGDPSTIQTKLTAQTLQSYQKGILFSSLPKTFQHAVIFARRFGIRYLWIDCLCIIQSIGTKDSSDDIESEVDWEEEVGKMCSIYENSFLTLAACFAADSRDGLFLEPEHKTVHIKGGSSEGPYYVMARRHTGKAHCPRGNPLLDRGWVTQEIYLSSRLLMFTDEELLWQCRTNVTCQCSGDIRNGRFDGPNKGWASDPDTNWSYWIEARQQLLADSPITDLNALCTWYQIVELYSNTSLTHNSDRLAAIDGIAQKFHSRSAGCYQYGLWSEHDYFICFLLWERDNLHSKLPSSQSRSQMLYPTWSWLSHPTAVRFQCTADRYVSGMQPECTQVIAKSQPKKKIGLDRNAPREICLRGVLVPATLTRLLACTSSVFVKDFELSSEIDPKSNLYCLRMATTWDEFYSLVLHRCRPADGDVFERVGLIRESSSRKPKGYKPFWWRPSADWVEETITVKII